MKKKVLGICPRCGSRYLRTGDWHSCEARCGFRVGDLFGAKLDDDQIHNLLGGKEVLISGCKSTKRKGTFALVVKMTGVRQFAYTKRNGQQRTGYDAEVARRFPDKKFEDK